MKMKSFLIFLSLVILSNANFWDCWIQKCYNIPTVPSVNITEYMGLWYEIARLPMFGEDGCECVEAIYTLNKNNQITVNNTCRKNSVTAPITYVAGKAWEDGSSSKLVVQFFWPFNGDYWILQLGPNYSYALVGEPELKLMWILSRTPTLEHKIVSNLTNYAESLGYNLENLSMTNQNCTGTNFPGY